MNNNQPTSFDAHLHRSTTAHITMNRLKSFLHDSLCSPFGVLGADGMSMDEGLASVDTASQEATIERINRSFRSADTCNNDNTCSTTTDSQPRSRGLRAVIADSSSSHQQKRCPSVKERRRRQSNATESAARKTSSKQRPPATAA